MRSDGDGRDQPYDFLGKAAFPKAVKAIDQLPGPQVRMHAMIYYYVLYIFCFNKWLTACHRSRKCKHVTLIPKY